MKLGSVVVGTKQMQAELKAAELASEAVKKENKILTFALKQKDKEIERLKELTRYLNSLLLSISFTRCNRIDRIFNRL